MSNEFHIEVQRTANGPLLRLRGDITAFAEARFDEAVQPLLKEGCAQMVLDFSGVDYINSAGIAVLIALVSAMKERNGDLAAIGLSPHYEKIFTMVGLTQYIKVRGRSADASATDGPA
ncbi:MAG: STAS domain-containing protein [Candidatus Tectomicrobia bacterium]|nr:STAS domain-containing protein [Candidatus Tectomicrobia bacterium]